MNFTSNSFCVCVERIGYAPIKWTDMLEKMKSARKDSTNEGAQDV